MCHLQEDDLEVHNVSDVRELESDTFPTEYLPALHQYKMAAAFFGMNVVKVLRNVGLTIGPEFIDHLSFPIWRPAVWREKKIAKGWSFIGIPQPEIPSAPHPFDFARSTRYTNCVVIRETPDPETMAGEDYLKHHKHGIVVSSLPYYFVILYPRLLRRGEEELHPDEISWADN